MRRHLQTLLCTVLLSALPLSAATFITNGPSTTNNDDSCDIALLPAATLLIPYFEVNLGVAGTETTIVTVTNTSHLPQAFAMTLWTDYGYPVVTFRYYLTGYDVVSINLYDVIRRGQVGGGDRGTGSDVSPVGRLSGPNAETDTDNPNLDEASCRNLPVQLPQVYISRMRDAFTLGRFDTVGTVPGCQNIGGVHTNAVGYATIDVVSACAATLPTDVSYFANEIGWSNVLMADYLQVDGANDFAQGSPAVHIRAIPEGGTSASRTNNNFTRSFYSHLQPNANRTRDGRQPLPSTFAARWISGGGSGFETFFKIWRGVETPANAACAIYDDNGAKIPMTEVVRFDEEENPETTFFGTIADPPMGPALWLPATSLTQVEAEHFPVNSNGAVGGWMYFNLHDGDDAYASQNWVVTSMRAEDRFSVDVDAAALGNGCSAPAAVSNANVNNAQPIGPAPNTNP
jgi:hypothetical protein